MSYSEDHGEVVLRMSKRDYEELLSAWMLFAAEHKVVREHNHRIMDRVNAGNPKYTPYEIGRQP